MKKNSCFIFFQFFWDSPPQLPLCEPGGKSGLGDEADAVTSRPAARSPRFRNAAGGAEG